MFSSLFICIGKLLYFWKPLYTKEFLLPALVQVCNLKSCPVLKLYGCTSATYDTRFCRYLGSLPHFILNIKRSTLSSILCRILIYFRVSNIHFIDVNLLHFNKARMALFCIFCSLSIISFEHRYNILAQYSKWGLIIAL